MNSDVVSVVGSYLCCGYWRWCRMNSWCCNRISDYITLLSSLWQEGFFISKRWLKNSGPSNIPPKVLATGKPSVAFSATWQLAGVAAAHKSRQWALLLPCCHLPFILDKTFICSVLPFFVVEGKQGGVWGVAYSIHTLLSPLLSSLWY